MREKLRIRFFPPHNTPHARQESKIVEEYTRKFKKLMMTCDL